MLRQVKLTKTRISVYLLCVESIMGGQAVTTRDSASFYCPRYVLWPVTHWQSSILFERFGHDPGNINDPIIGPPEP